MSDENVALTEETQAPTEETPKLIPTSLIQMINYVKDSDLLVMKKF